MPNSVARNTVRERRDSFNFRHDNEVILLNVPVRTTGGYTINDNEAFCRKVVRLTKVKGCRQPVLMLKTAPYRLPNARLPILAKIRKV